MRNLKTLPDYLRMKNGKFTDEEYRFLCELYTPSKLEKTVLYLILTTDGINYTKIANVCKKYCLSQSSSITACIRRLINQKFIYYTGIYDGYFDTWYTRHKRFSTFYIMDFYHHTRNRTFYIRDYMENYLYRYLNHHSRLIIAELL